nr:TIM barrel protein [Vallitaleaceae bacterium]
GLTAVSSHTPLEQLEHDLDAVIAYNQIIGNTNIVCPWSEWHSDEEFQFIIQVLKAATRILKKAGFNLYYHNHAHEFVDMNGLYALDILFEETKAEGMLMELDTYWVEMAGLDTVVYMEAHASRCKLIHLKDMIIEDGKKVPAAIGEGTMPIKAILDKAKALQIPWIIVENDFPKPNGIENVARSIVYLKSIL